MDELNLVPYSVDYKGNRFTIEYWKGTPLGHVWNDIKSFYLPGDIVSITDTSGKSMTFMKGMC